MSRDHVLTGQHVVGQVQVLQSSHRRQLCREPEKEGRKEGHIPGQRVAAFSPLGGKRCRFPVSASQPYPLPMSIPLVQIQTSLSSTLTSR